MRADIRQNGRRITVSADRMNSLETEHRQPMMDPVQRRIQQNDAFVHLPGMRVDAYCFKTGFCGMFQMQRCDDAAGEIGIYPVCEDVGTGTNGLCRQLDVYPSEKEQIENRSHAEKYCSGGFFLEYSSHIYMYLGNYHACRSILKLTDKSWILM